MNTLPSLRHTLHGFHSSLIDIEGRDEPIKFFISPNPTPSCLTVWSTKDAADKIFLISSAPTAVFEVMASGHYERILAQLNARLRLVGDPRQLNSFTGPGLHGPKDERCMVHGEVNSTGSLCYTFKR